MKLFFLALTCCAQSLVIENVTIIDATGAAPRPAKIFTIRRKIEAVIMRGRCYSRKDLSETLKPVQ